MAVRSQTEYMNFRPYRTQDYASIATWMNALARFYDGHDNPHMQLLDQLTGIEDHRRDGFYTVNKIMFVSENLGQPNGMICLNEKRGGSVKIGPVIVNPEARGLGIGQRLMEQTMDYALTHDVRKLYATTSEQNEAMNHIFEKFGFEVEAIYPDHYRKGSNELIWGLHIIPPIHAKGVISSAVLDDKTENNPVSIWAYNKSKATDLAFINRVIELFGQWHEDTGVDFIEAILRGHERAADTGLKFQDKSKIVFLGNNSPEEPEGMAIFTPKRGGPVKLYPIAGTMDSQLKIIEAATVLADYLGNHKLYTFAHVEDVREIKLLESAGFIKRGVLQSPYKSGHDLVTFDLSVR